MIYKIDSTPLSDFGAIPSPDSGHFALSGMLDLPRRIGSTEYDWGTSIEPFVDAEDIELDGRTLTLNVAIKKAQLQAFKEACVACTELGIMDESIGGRNLLRNSDFLKPYSDGTSPFITNWSLWGNALISSHGWLMGDWGLRFITIAGDGRFQQDLLTNADTLTFSADVIGTGPMRRYVMDYGTNTKLSGGFLNISTETKGRYRLSIPGREGGMRFGIGYNSNSVFDNFQIGFVKLEEGNNPNPIWTPAPEDVFFPIPVIQKDEIKVIPVGEYCKVSVPFWQNTFELRPVTITPSGTGEYMIDNFNLVKDFGIYVAESGNTRNTAKRIDVQTTEFYQKAQYRGLRTIDLSCSMKGINFTDIYYKMAQFQSVLMAPGLHTLKIRNNTLSVYFKDGMKVDILNDNIAQFNLRVTVI